MTRWTTVARVRVELYLEVELPGPHPLGPDLDNAVLPRVVGAELWRGSERLAEVEVGDARVVEARDREVSEPWDDDWDEFDSYGGEED